MKVKNKKRKKYSPAKTVKRFMKGLEISWSVQDPLALEHELESQHFRHVSGVKNLIMTSMLEVVQPALHSLPYKWHVDVTMEFYSAETGTYLKGYSMVASALLRRLNDSYYDMVEKLFAEANMAHYQMTHIKCVILAEGETKEEDFA